LEQNERPGASRIASVSPVKLEGMPLNKKESTSVYGADPSALMNAFLLMLCLRTIDSDLDPGWSWVLGRLSLAFLMVATLSPQLACLVFGQHNNFYNGDMELKKRIKVPIPMQVKLRD